MMNFVCPRCKGDLGRTIEGYACGACRSDYPIVCGIPDFRIHPDPYIGIEADRKKGAYLDEASKGKSFEELLRFYYQITLEDPPDLAVRWIAHSLAETQIAEELLRAAALQKQLPLLDMGCSTGGLIVAAHRAGWNPVAGIDVAFRWLVAGRVRLRESGVNAPLVCANAEALPFAGGTFGTVTATDLLEHVRDASQAIDECHRVLRDGGETLWTMNNRYCPLPDPHVGLWGIGFLPRSWQPRYLAWRRPEMHRFEVRPSSAHEIDGYFRASGFEKHATAASPLIAPHWRSPWVQAAMASYNGVRGVPVISALAKAIGPRLWTRAER